MSTLLHESNQTALSASFQVSNNWCQFWWNLSLSSICLGKVNFALSSTDHTFYLLNLIWNYLSTKRAQCLNYEVSFLQIFSDFSHKNCLYNQAFSWSYQHACCANL